VRRPLLIAALLVSSLLALPTAASAEFTVGFGEQRPTMFTDPNWQALGLTDARLVVGWDALGTEWQRAEVDAWIAAAQAAGARPLIALTRSRTPSKIRKVPTAAQYKKAFLEFRKRYPLVKDYITWNEANHCSQPVCHKPKTVAKYYDTMVKYCKGCRIVAADLLDLASVTKWIPVFKKAVKHRPKIWVIHNYIDANRFTTVGTKRMLKLTSGQLWFTETGGVVKRSKTSPIKFPSGLTHAAKATDYVLRKLTKVSPRVKRVYLYHFQHQGLDNPWDSGILDRLGKPRPAYKVVQKRAKKAGFAPALPLVG